MGTWGEAAVLVETSSIARSGTEKHLWNCTEIRYSGGTTISITDQQVVSRSLYHMADNVEYVCFDELSQSLRPRLIIYGSPTG